MKRFFKILILGIALTTAGAMTAQAASPPTKVDQKKKKKKKKAPHRVSQPGAKAPSASRR